MVVARAIRAVLGRSGDVITLAAVHRAVPNQVASEATTGIHVCLLVGVAEPASVCVGLVVALLLMSALGAVGLSHSAGEDGGESLGLFDCHLMRVRLALPDEFGSLLVSSLALLVACLAFAFASFAFTFTSFAIPVLSSEELSDHVAIHGDLCSDLGGGLSVGGGVGTRVPLLIGVDGVPGDGRFSGDSLAVL